jgi:CRISPR-associated endonuclease Cas1
VQNVLDAAKPTSEKPFVSRERDADYAAIDAAMGAGSTIRAEFERYAAQCSWPYAFSHFSKRLAEWRTACLAGGRAVVARSPEGATRQRKPSLASGRAVIARSPKGATWQAERAQPKTRVACRDDLATKLLLRAETDGIDRSGPLETVVTSSANASEPLPTSINHHTSKTAPFDFVGVTPLERGLLWISERDAALQIRKGALCVRYGNGIERTFPRGRHGIQAIILNSPGANITIESIRFCIDEGIILYIMHRAGEALAILTDAPTTNADTRPLALRRAQFAANPKQRLNIAKAILSAKIAACELPKPDAYQALDVIAKARSHENLLLTEAATAKVYWKRYIGFELKLAGRAPAAWAVFRGRLEKYGTQHIPRWARTPHNAALNYGYAVALGGVTRALVGLGADPCYGFVHHFDKPQRLSLSYDALELLRPSVDACVFQWLGSRSFDRQDFIELNSQVLLSQRLAREVAMRVLADVTREDCEKAARAVAGLIMSETNQTK